MKSRLSDIESRGRIQRCNDLVTTSAMSKTQDFEMSNEGFLFTFHGLLCYIHCPALVEHCIIATVLLLGDSYLHRHHHHHHVLVITLLTFTFCPRFLSDEG